MTTSADKIFRMRTAQAGNWAMKIVDTLTEAYDSGILGLSLKVECHDKESTLKDLVNKINSGSYLYYWIVMVLDGLSTNLILKIQSKEVLMCSNDGKFAACGSIKYLLENLTGGTWKLIILDQSVYEADQLVCKLLSGIPIQSLTTIRDGLSVVNSVKKNLSRVTDMI